MTMLGKLFHLLRQANRLANRYAGALLAVGLVAVALHNWRQWQRDKAFLAQRGEPAPLPALASWPDLPKVSVLAAAWNEAAHIERHIASFRALRYPHKELVLCAGGEDETYELAMRQAGPDVRVLRQKAGEGKQRALARAFPATHGAVIFLTDADCLLADEPFERTLWPVAAGDEQVATGSYQPFHEQLDIPFVYAQAATQLYSTLRRPRYAPGISGANCALCRAILEATAAFDVPAPTGTDYVLAKTLIAAGARIRHVPESRMPTEYPLTAREYVRQQSRWLKNLLFRGYRHRDWFHVRAALIVMALAFTMIGLPILLPLLGLSVIWLFLILWTHTLLARFRYVRHLQVVDPRATIGNPITMIVYVAIADYLAAIKAALDVLTKGSRTKW